MDQAYRNTARAFACAAVTVAGAISLLPGSAAAKTPAERQTYVESGTYSAELKAAIDPAKQWITRRAAANAKQTQACEAAGYPVGSADPGPDPQADYSVVVPEPAPEAVAAVRLTPARARTAVKRAQRSVSADRARVRSLSRRLARAQRDTAALRRSLAKARRALKQSQQALAAARKALDKALRTPAPGGNTNPVPTTPAPATPKPDLGNDVPPIEQPPAPDPDVTKKSCAAVEKLAIGFDADETAFSNYHAFAPTANYQDLFSIRNQALGTGIALGPVLELYRLARRYEVSVFIITARFDPILADPSNRALYESGSLCRAPYDAIGLCGIDLTRYDYRGITQRNLAEAGYTEVEGLYMRPENGTDKGVVKASQRAELERRRGYEVIAMVGDNGSDIAGGWYEKGFRIPTLD
ncbi:HAD family acid phosphatase [Conexibacter sp. JD483]|uniref:HAD family acid phosphatase n=1 Tax=unclassified Conexibacter TaxID=2627773 RepID=UPI00271EBE77|nr:MULTISPECIES: HAD family acid phosphatase [unclassified Conexibacter]MDO8187615.1 HAD family acid phosphatase [Conexibacter sp. CPCC 205706]MDO8201053.1 HAD family acid phosphatase [Conexibacter sp. CPCC 205762]MDR9372505.1 HAD family acid phosphatase [Conexibacter sp. JD483]